MSRIEFRVTFGSDQAIHRDGWLAVDVPDDDEIAARVAVIQHIGRGWSSIYHPRDDWYPTRQVYPLGELSRITVTDQPAAPAKRLYTGATQVEIHEIFEAYVKVLTAADGPLPAQWREDVAKVLGGFGDAWRNQIDDPEPADLRDVSTVEEIRKEAGLCPDAGDHFYGAECHDYECPTYRLERADELAAEAGVWR